MRLFAHVVSLEARKLMSYRVDFWVNAVAGLVTGIVIPYFLWKAIFAQAGTSTIGGYTFEGMLFYYVVVTLLCKVVQGPNLAQSLSRDIYEGELSKYLVYPTGYLRFKYAQHVGSTLPGLVQLVVFGVAFALLLDLPSDEAVRPVGLLLCAISVVAANVLFFLLAYPLQAVAFWADNVWSLNVTLHLVSAFFGGLLVPLSLYPEWARTILAASPFPYLYAVPVDALLGKVTPLEWARGLVVVLAWCGVVGLVGRLVWRRGERAYSGVGM